MRSASAAIARCGRSKKMEPSGIIPQANHNPPTMAGVPRDSEDAASIQFAPSDFLSLGRASIVSATAIAPPANCDSGGGRSKRMEPSGLNPQANHTPPTMSSVSRDSEDAASIQFAPSDFLSLGRASDVSATALAPPVNCDSEHLPKQFQANGLAPKAKPRRKKHRAKVIREDKQRKKQKPAATTSPVKPWSSLSKPVNHQSISGGAEDAARSRTAAVRRRLQFELGELGLQGEHDQSSTAKSSSCSATTISTITQSRDSIILRAAAQTLAFGQAGGVKKKRSVRLPRTSFVAIVEQTLTRLPQPCMDALYEISHIKFITKKRSQRGRLHSSNQPKMDRKNMSSSGNSFSGLSNGSDGRFQQAASLSNAIVPFGGQMIVPYERPLHLVKERQPRAKVNLDSETIRIWNLLMGKATEPVDGTDVNKERWWEQERKVFKGRADSFITRMQLVQGDRRFSPWKGSVVDSVVGVFLTQNVSDHLSSSAYMALAATFPPRSINSNCKHDITSQDSEEITSMSAVGEISMFNFCDTSSSGASSSLLKNGPTGKKLPLPMPSDNHTSTDLPVELHCEKSTRFEASDFQEHESLSATSGIIAETVGKADGFTSTSGFTSDSEVLNKATQASRQKKTRTVNKKNIENIDWDEFRRQACDNGYMKERKFDRRDSVDWEAVRCADVHKISNAIRERGMNNVLAE